MKAYMPDKHRQWLSQLERAISSDRMGSCTIRDYIMSLAQDHHPLKVAFNSCVQQLSRFRALHKCLVTSYIVSQQKATASKPGLEMAAGLGKGTGGMELDSFLAPLYEDTKRCVIPLD